MEILGQILLLAIVIPAGIVIGYVLGFRRLVIFEYQRGLVYRNGKYLKLWEPGLHWYHRLAYTVHRMDVRTRIATIPGQEVLSSDGVSIKVSLAATYKVVDPYKAFNTSANYEEALHVLLQLGLRDLVGAIPMDDLLAKRKEIGSMLLAGSKEKAAGLGIELAAADIKDIMFPGELKNIYAQVLNARKEGLAALERARGETAALRNLANAAKIMESNPALFQLRLLQALGSNSGNTIILSPSFEENSLPGLPRRKAKAK
jgi:regulator of protease activity HflC (stomatin/prohibitin superfamily)